MNIPPVQLVRQIAPQPAVGDVAAETRRAILESPLARRIQPGMKIALGCGSRGIRNYLTLAQTAIATLQELGAKPFALAAMGSHGGATADGQRELLASYGITPENLGVPVVTDMDAVAVGENSWGQPVWWDKNALAADGVILLNRVKPHTDFRGRYESGICKMMVIGLGKRHGADQVHSFGTRGLRDMLIESAKVLIAKTPFLGGIAVLENANEETAKIVALDRDEVLEKEPPLLEEAKRIMGRIPFPQIDVLVVGECGKNYSGAGMDPNVVGRMLIEASPEAETNNPRIVRMAVLDVSPESHGNATGIGIADLTTNRALSVIDPLPFRMNNLTARFLWRSKLPIGFDTDRQCIQAAVDTCWNPIQDTLKVCIIPNTLEVAELWVSPALAAEVNGNGDLELVGTAQELPFDSVGNLVQEKLFPHSVRGRRTKH